MLAIPATNDAGVGSLCILCVSLDPTWLCVSLGAAASLRISAKWLVP